MLGYQDKNANNPETAQHGGRPGPAGKKNTPTGLFDSVFHEVNEAIAIVGRDPASKRLTILDVNRQFERCVGCSGQNIRGKAMSSFFPAIDAPLEKILAAKPDSMHPGTLKLEGLRADGTEFCAEFTVKSFSSPTSSGELIFILRPPGTETSTYKDEITSKILSSMSHDLRTPLNGIIGFSEIMMTEMLGPIGTECYRNYAQDIHGAGRDLLRVIDGLLDVTSSIRGENLPMRRERFSLRACVAAAVAESATKARQRAVALKIRSARDLPDMMGDYGRLLAAFTFVLANPLNRSPENGAISVSVKKINGNTAEFICRDKGARLTDAELAHIFEPFRVSSDVYIAGAADFGVGFSLVKLTVEHHDGSVAVKSSDNGGLELTIRLPLATRA